MSQFDPILASKALWQIRVRRRPFVLSHGVNARCNMRCRFCEYWKKTGEEPTKEEIFKLLDDAREFGIGVYNAWTVEPLLRKDLPQIMAHAKEIGMITSMVTNGKLLYERSEELGDVDYLSVSVDGIDSYKEIRKMDFETLLRGLKKAIEVRKTSETEEPCPDELRAHRKKPGRHRDPYFACKKTGSKSFLRTRPRVSRNQ